MAVFSVPPVPIVDPVADVTYTSTDIPTPQTPSVVSIPNASTGSGTALVAKNVQDGDVDFRTNALNPNAAMIDRLASSAAPCHAVNAAYPPTLTAGSGLTLNVSAGECLIGGPVQIPAKTLALPDNTSPVWIWLKQDGTLHYTTTTTPPSGEVCLIGAAITASGVITAIDTSGVMYLMGGQLVRQTTDIGAPVDTPPSTIRLWTRTTTGLYLWDGAIHRQFPGLMRAHADTLGATDTEYIGLGRQVWLDPPFTNSGTLAVAGKLRIN